MISIHLIAVIAVYHLFSVFFSFVLIWAASNSSRTLYRYGWCQQSGEDFAATHPWRVQRNTHRCSSAFSFVKTFWKLRESKKNKIFHNISRWSLPLMFLPGQATATQPWSKGKGVHVQTFCNVKPLRLSLFDSEFWWLSKYCQVQQVQQIKHVQDGRGKMERMGRAKERRKEKTRTGRVKTSAMPEGILSCVGGDVWNEWHFEKCSVLLELSTTCRHCVVRNFGQCLLLSKQLLVSPVRPVKTLGA